MGLPTRPARSADLLIAACLANRAVALFGHSPRCYHRPSLICTSCRCLLPSQLTFDFRTPQVAKLEREKKAAEAEQRRLAERAAQAEQRLEALQAQLGAEQDARKRAQGQVAEVQGRLTEVEGERDALRSRCALLERAKQQLERWHELQAQLQQQQQEMEQLRVQLQQVQ